VSATVGGDSPRRPPPRVFLPARLPAVN